MAVIYEVTLHAQAHIADAYLAWLRMHIGEVLALPYFDDAQLCALETGSVEERSWCVRYRMRDRGSLDDYLRDQAPRMRADGIARFGTAFRAERRILTPLDY